MISIVGNILLFTSMIASLGAVILKNRQKFICFYLGSIFPVFAFGLLVFAFIISDFSLKNVFLNSSTVLPLIYKISASWASHEGSIVLWFSLLSLVSIAYVYSSKVAVESKEFCIMVLSFVQLLFISFIIFTSNPFETFSFIPKEGLGLNPMLQDVALSIHPPLLYLGNVTYIALFVNGCLLLYKPNEKVQILDISKKFSNFALMMLTIGIGLGSWWAYRELGWGGFWFFDPVENISLLPWIAGIALHHFLIISIKNGKFISWTIILSLICFLLTIYGTFIVRSGVISSVHAFAFSPERGMYIFSICIVITLLCFMWFLVKCRNLPKVSTGSNARYDIIVLAGNILWLISLVSLIISLIYPVYSSFILGDEVVVDPEYFIFVFIPIFIPILFLAAIVSVIPNGFTSTSNIVCIILSSIITIYLSFLVDFSIITLSVSFSAIYLILQTTILFWQQNSSVKKYSLFLGHFGFGLLALSITLNSLLSQEIEFIGKIGNSTREKDIKVKLENIKFSEGENYYRQIAVFNVEDKNSNIVFLKPENRLYKIENTLSQEVDIYSFLFYDLYAVLSRVDRETIHAKIYYQPGISFIWLSVFLIVSSFFLLLFRQKT